MTFANLSITAIVPTYNRSAFLAEALDNLLHQTKIVDEIIIWDDGSTDNTQEVVQNTKGPVRYFRSENGGKSKALNAAMAQARGDLIWICDDDDIAVPEAAEILTGMLCNNPSAGLVAGSYRRFSDDPITGERRFSGPGYWPDLRRGSILRHLLEDIFLFQNATLVRRSCYEAVGPFREDLPRSIDYDMIVRLAARFPTVVTEVPLFYQRKHDGARGPASARHAAARSDEVWKAADRQVFDGVLDILHPALFTGMFDADMPLLAERAGCLQRACVFARRTDWQAALRDLHKAAELLPDMRLSPTELMICRRAMAGKHGCDEVLTPDMRGEVARLAATSALGAEITAALVRGLGWRVRKAVREGNRQVVRPMLVFAARILSAGGARRPKRQASLITERSDPLLLPDLPW